MSWKKENVLRLLDLTAKDLTFPFLDNGYIKIAATRLSVYRTSFAWAIVIEIFSFSAQSGEPHIQNYTFSNSFSDCEEPLENASPEDFHDCLKNNTHVQLKYFHPFDNTDWMNSSDSQSLNVSATCKLRGVDITQPTTDEYAKHSIKLEEDSPLTFEFCRFLASKHRDLVLCNEEERRISVAPEMTLFMTLDEWHHPNIMGGELPSSSPTFQQLAEVIESGQVTYFKKLRPANTHWSC